MKKIILVLTLLFSINYIISNDGAYFSNGSVIYPINETKISMEKEILSFKVNEKKCDVEVYFEFNNPENVTRKLLVGFQAPSPNGDVIFKNNIHDFIKDFKILNENKILNYEQKVSECEDCELKDSSDNDYLIYVFLFEIDFKPGINIVKHSYSFQASGGIEISEYYEYILKTGSKWASNKIKNLTINIDLGANKYFFIKDVFGKSAIWNINGTGKLINFNNVRYDDTLRMVRIINGFLQIKVNDFFPKENLYFGIENPVFYDYYFQNIYHQIINLNEKDYETKNNLRYLRNAIYAQYGYNFKDKTLNEYFSKFEWYIPNPNLKIEDIKLTQKETEVINEITQFERQLSK